MKCKVLIELEFEVQAVNADLATRYHRAAAEAATLAWMTPYPLLVLPVLLEEKLHTARLEAERQKEIRGRSQVLMARAA